MNVPLSIPSGLDFAIPADLARLRFRSRGSFGAVPGNRFVSLRFAINRTFALVCCLTVATVSATFAQPIPEFAKANQDFAQGHFQDAITGYETLVRSGQWNANLFYDLGNAYFRM